MPSRGALEFAVSQDDLVRAFLATAQKFELSDTEIAAVTGLAPFTIQSVRKGHSLPVHTRRVTALARFVARGTVAQRRSDFSLPDRGTAPCAA